MDLCISLLQGHSNTKYSYNFSPFQESIPEGTTVIKLKKIIHKRWKVHPKQQQLTYSGISMDDDNKRLVAYGIASGTPVLVELVAASIWLTIKRPGGDSLAIDDVNLNSSIESLKEKAKGDAVCLTSEQIELSFKEMKLDWAAPLRSIEGLEDGSELVSQLPFIQIRIIGFDTTVRLLRVDLNWTVQQVKDKLLGKSSNRTEYEDSNINKVVSNLLMPNVLLCFQDYTLEWTTCLRQITNFDSESELKCILFVPGA